jgi:hypothetical protein
MRDAPRNEHLAVGQLDRLRPLILVLMARVGGSEAVRAGVHLQHEADDVGQGRLVCERPEGVFQVSGPDAEQRNRSRIRDGIQGVADAGDVGVVGRR